MGPGVPYALAARLACPDRTGIAVRGFRQKLTETYPHLPGRRHS
ncbi:hypothetical protein [Streptomyces gossypii]|nr:hypothetical protein [Streptomyces gossypii]